MAAGDGSGQGFRIGAGSCGGISATIFGVQSFRAGGE